MTTDARASKLAGYVKDNGPDTMPTKTPSYPQDIAVLRACSTKLCAYLLNIRPIGVEQCIVATVKVE